VSESVHSLKIFSFFLKFTVKKEDRGNKYKMVYSGEDDIPRRYT